MPQRWTSANNADPHTLLGKASLCRTVAANSGKISPADGAHPSLPLQFPIDPQLPVATIATTLRIVIDHPS